MLGSKMRRVAKEGTWDLLADILSRAYRMDMEKAAPVLLFMRYGIIAQLAVKYVEAVRSEVGKGGYKRSRRREEICEAIRVGGALGRDLHLFMRAKFILERICWRGNLLFLF